MSRYISAELRRRVQERFSHCCAYCRSAEALTVATFEIEHITPLAVGGETRFDNLCLACPSCNRYKATRLQAVDPATGEQVALFHPQRERWKDHFRWTEGGTLLQGLTPQGRATTEALKMNRPQLAQVRKLWIKLGEHPPELDIPV